VFCLTDDCNEGEGGWGEEALDGGGDVEGELWDKGEGWPEVVGVLGVVADC
jgi:hypothetical protein